MKLFISAALILICTVLLSACGTTKYYFEKDDCEEIANGIVCAK